MTQTNAGFASHDEETVRRDDRAHVFHSWSAQDLIDPLPIASAQGSFFSDYAGKSYLDFSSQLVNVNIGYQHPKLVAAIAEQAGRLCTIQPAFANDARSEAARWADQEIGVPLMSALCCHRPIAYAAGDDSTCS